MSQIDLSTLNFKKLSAKYRLPVGELISEAWLIQAVCPEIGSAELYKKVSSRCMALVKHVCAGPTRSRADKSIAPTRKLTAGPGDLNVCESFNPLIKTESQSILDELIQREDDKVFANRMAQLDPTVLAQLQILEGAHYASDLSKKMNVGERQCRNIVNRWCKDARARARKNHPQQTLFA